MWYADDSAATGKTHHLHEWWNKLTESGPAFGYFPNPSKTWIATKPEHIDKATGLFANTQALTSPPKADRTLVQPLGHRTILVTMSSQKYKSGYRTCQLSVMSPKHSRMQPSLPLPMGY